MAASDTCAFFVYGTLKRGECRHSAWPAPARGVDEAFIRGALYDLGPYPALTTGSDWVRGELWRFASADYAIVRATLDEIEVYNQQGEPDLYQRRTVDVYSSPGGEPLATAETYFFFRLEQLTPERRVLPIHHAANDRPYAAWTTQAHL